MRIPNSLLLNNSLSNNKSNSQTPANQEHFTRKNHMMSLNINNNIPNLNNSVHNSIPGMLRPDDDKLGLRIINYVA